MCLFLEQVDGDQADMADEFRKARVDGASLETLEDIFRRATGKSFREGITLEDCWLTFNASSVIRTHYEMPKGEWGKMSQRHGRFWQDKRSAMEDWASQVGRKNGGTWKVVYEY